MALLIIRLKSVQNSIAGMLLNVLSLQESTATSCEFAVRLNSQMSAQLRRVQAPTKSGAFDFHERNGNPRCLNPQEQVESLHRWYGLVCG
jgi:hypothetical protein